MACSGNLVKIALGQLKNVKIALATLRQFFYIFHLTLSNFPQIAFQPMRLLVSKDRTANIDYINKIKS